MLNRWIGITITLLMLLANAAIFCRDVLPRWQVQDPPPNPAFLLAPGQKEYVQVRIVDEAGREIGTSWTLGTRSGLAGFVTVKTTTILNPLCLPGAITTPRVRVETAVTYRDNDAAIDELDFKIFGLGIPVVLHGEAMPSGEFPFTWQIGEYRDKAVLDSRVPVALGDVIRPFDRLPNLYVGRTWQLDLLDPLSQVLPQLKQTGLGLEPVLVQVTRTETIMHGEEPIDAFVVEGGGATAWVAPDGRVLRQEVVVPLLGKLVLLDQPYDEAAHRRVLLGSGVRGPSSRETDTPFNPADDEEEESAAAE
jgi:hypothetical protein